MDDNKCPRRIEGPFVCNDAPDIWRDGDTCSYCGSLSPEAFFKAIAEGCELGPTDKNYKVYVSRPNPKVGQQRIVSMASHKQSGDSWIQVTDEHMPELRRQGWGEHNLGSWMQCGPESALTHEKFYFQHLSEEQRTQFVDLMNTRKVNIGYPGHFYALPFFCTRIPRSEQNT